MTEAAFYSALVQALIVFGVAAFFVERALFQVFNAKLRGKKIAHLLEFWGFDLKPWISKALCVWIVFAFDYDLIAKVFMHESTLIATKVLSGVILAGGSTWIFQLVRRIRKGMESGLEDEMLAATEVEADFY